MLGQLWGFSVSECLYFRAMVSPSQKLLRRNVSISLCSYICFCVISCVQQIHLLQFHGTRYAAIDPSMVSAEELEVQKISLHTSNEQEEQ